jgi:hypothetical protein
MATPETRDAEYRAWIEGDGPEPDWAGEGFSTPYPDPELEAEAG